jgi:hypothetical protein
MEVISIDYLFQPNMWIVWRGRSPGSQNNIIFLVGERIFVDDFSRQYFLRNAVGEGIASGFLKEAIQVPAKSAEIPIVHRTPKR